MAALLDGLRLRREMGRDEYLPPTEYGTGWQLLHRAGDGSVLVSAFPLSPDDVLDGDVSPDDVWYVHASMTRHQRVPSYEDLCRLHRAVWGDSGYAYQVFAPRAKHINVHPYALHLWGRLDGRPILPEFAVLFGVGSI